VSVTFSHFLSSSIFITFFRVSDPFWAVSIRDCWIDCLVCLPVCLVCPVCLSFALPCSLSSHSVPFHTSLLFSFPVLSLLSPSLSHPVRSRSSPPFKSRLLRQRLSSSRGVPPLLSSPLIFPSSLPPRNLGTRGANLLVLA